MTTGSEGRDRRLGPAGDDPFEPGDPLELAVARLRDVPPAVDLWPGVHARIAGSASTARRVVSFTLPQLAMAATLLIAVSAACRGWRWDRGRRSLPPRLDP